MDTGLSYPVIGECLSLGLQEFFYGIGASFFLIFGSETWNLTATTLKSLEGFQMQAGWHMAHVNKPRRGQDGCWTYPAPSTVLAEVVL